MIRKKKPPSLAIVILNYNGGDFLKKCLASVFSSFSKRKRGVRLEELVVVDNNSKDKSREYLMELKKNPPPLPFSLQIIFNQENRGFSAGNNRGVEVVLSRRPKYVLFLNPDTVVSFRTIQGAVSFLEKNPRVGACSVLLRLPDGRVDEACHRGFPTPWRSFCHFSGLGRIFKKSRLFSGYTLGYRWSKKPHRIDACSGAFLLVRTKAGEEVGWWDEDYFFYGEDIDFCYRLKKKGWDIFFLPQFEILHFRGVSSGLKKHSQKVSSASLSTRIRAARESARAMRIFYQKHYRKKYPLLVDVLVGVGIFFLEKVRVLLVFVRYLLFRIRK